MARRVITLDEKINKAEAAVVASKAKYDAALDELERLVTKRKEQDDKKLLAAYHDGDKTLDEIIAFIQSGNESEGKNRRTKKPSKGIEGKKCRKLRSLPLLDHRGASLQFCENAEHISLTTRAQCQ